MRPAPAAKPARATASSFIIKTSADPVRSAPAPAAQPHRKAAHPLNRSEAGSSDQDKLLNLANLRNSGAISEEEFYRRKRELMGK